MSRERILRLLLSQSVEPAGEVRGLDISRPAADLINDIEGTPHAFLFACLADRQVSSNMAWGLPWHLRQRVGGFEIDHLHRLSSEAWETALNEPSPLHRFTEMTAKSLHLATHRICEQYDGDAAQVWGDGCGSHEAVRRFKEFHGAGPKIANMAVNILVRDFGIEFADRSAFELAPDTHAKRVFARLGLVPADPSPEQVMRAARKLNPEWPGCLDWPVWNIGSLWCHASYPDCPSCPLRTACPTAA